MNKGFVVVRPIVAILVFTIFLAGCGSETHSFACDQLVGWAEPRVRLVNQNSSYEDFGQLDAGELSSDVASGLALMCTEAQPKWECVSGGTYALLLTLSSVVEQVKSGELDKASFETTNGITQRMLNKKFDLLKEGNDSTIQNYCTSEESARSESNKYTTQFCLNAYDRLNEIAPLFESRQYVIENETELTEFRKTVSSCTTSYEEAKLDIRLRVIMKLATSPSTDDEYQQNAQEGLEELKIELQRVMVKMNKSH